MADLVGQILADKYRVLRLLGKGGMGQVYEVELVSLPKRFAIKVLSPELAREKEALLRFRREAELIARLNHPNLVEILDWYSLPDGMHFYVMEVLKGQDLDQRIKSQGPLSMPEVASLARQSFSGLLEAHRQGAIHRDLKPANVFISDDPSGIQVKIIDFGLARARDMASITIYTQPMLIGTPAYMSPEQISGQGPADESADCWAMAALLYEATAGQPPFQGSFPLLLTLIGKQRPVPLRVHRPDAPIAFADVIASALSPNAETRLRSTAELAAQVEAALTGSPTAAVQEGRAAQPVSENPLLEESSEAAPTKNERLLREEAPLSIIAPSVGVKRVRRGLLAAGALLCLGLIVVLAVGGDEGKGDASAEAAVSIAAGADFDAAAALPPETTAEAEAAALAEAERTAALEVMAIMNPKPGAMTKSNFVIPIRGSSTSVVTVRLEAFGRAAADAKTVKQRFQLRYVERLRRCHDASRTDAEDESLALRFRLTSKGRVEIQHLLSQNDEIDACVRKQVPRWVLGAPKHLGDSATDFFIIKLQFARDSETTKDGTKSAANAGPSTGETVEVPRVGSVSVKSPFKETPKTDEEQKRAQEIQQLKETRLLYYEVGKLLKKLEVQRPDLISLGSFQSEYARFSLSKLIKDRTLLSEYGRKLTSLKTRINSRLKVHTKTNSELTKRSADKPKKKVKKGIGENNMAPSF